MPLFLYSLLVFALFIFLLCILSVRSRLYFLFAINVIGLLAAAFAFAQEYIGAQTKLSLVVSISIILVVILFDLAQVILQMINDRKEYFSNPELWEKFMANRNYNMIFREEKFNADLERANYVEMSENMQALQAWKQGNQAFLQGNFAEALKKYETSLDWRQTGVVYINKSGVSFENKNYHEVIQNCEKAIKINPDLEEAWLNKGLAHEAVDELEKAMKCFEEALVVNRNNAKIFLLLGNVQKKLGKFEDALDNYEKAAALAPGDFDIWYEKGITLSLLRQPGNALDSFNQAISINPKHATVYYHLANTLNKLDKNREAASAYQKVLRYNPEFPEAWNNLGIAFSKLGQLKDSVKSYQKAIEIKPDYYEAWLNKGLASETLKKYKDASVSYIRFLELAPDSLAKHRSIARKHLDDIEKSEKKKIRKKESKEIDDSVN